MAIKQEVNAPLIVTSGVVSGLLLLVVVFGVQAWFVRAESEEIAQKWEASPNTQLQELRAKQLANVQATGPVENQKGVKRIPIDQAMQILAQNGGKMPKTKQQ